MATTVQPSEARLAKKVSGGTAAVCATLRFALLKVDARICAAVADDALRRTRHRDAPKLRSGAPSCVLERLNELTDNKGPDKCIDATGLEARVSWSRPDTVYDRAKQLL